MAQKTLTEQYVPTKKEMEKINDNFDENYASVDSVEEDITAIKAGQGILLVEYADNAAAVTGGLDVGDLYMTTGAVKVVTA